MSLIGLVHCVRLGCSWVSESDWFSALCKVGFQLGILSLMGLVHCVMWVPFGYMSLIGLVHCVMWVPFGYLSLIDLVHCKRWSSSWVSEPD